MKVNIGNRYRIKKAFGHWSIGDTVEVVGFLPKHDDYNFDVEIKIIKSQLYPEDENCHGEYDSDWFNFGEWELIGTKLLSNVIIEL